MKKLSIILLSLVLVLCISGVGLAMEWTLSGGAQYQYGNYNVTVIESGSVGVNAFIESESDSFDASVPAPKLNYTLNVSSGNWVGSAFYGDSGSVTAKLPEDYLDSDETPYGRSSAYGVDLGYLFTYNTETMPLSIMPMLGYRDTLLLMGASSKDGDEFYSYFNGLEVRGVRLGLEIAIKCTEEITIKANGGFYPILTFYQSWGEIYDDSEDEGSGQFIYKWAFANQTKSAFDIDLNVNYKIKESISLLAGYRYEKGSADCGPVGYEAIRYEYNSSRIYAGIKYEF